MNLKPSHLRNKDNKKVKQQFESKIVTFLRSDIIFNNLASVMLNVRDMTDEKNLLTDAKKQKFRS